MLKAKDVMTKNLVTVSTDTPIFEAMQKLVDHRVSGMPVVDEDNRLMGIVAEKDMLTLLYDPDSEHSLVGDYMAKKIISCDAEDSLFDVCNCLIKNSFRRIPIVSNGKLVGLISRRDILRSALEARQKNMGI